MAKKNTAAAAATEPEQIEITIPEATRKPRISMIPHASIHPDPEQPRVHADSELRASLASRGQLEPIIVRPHPELPGEYMIVNGERRWRGSEGILEELAAIVRRDEEDGYLRLVDQVVANSGKPLTPLEEARTYARAFELLGEEATIDRVARDFGQPRSSVAERLALLDIGRPWLEMLNAGKITVSQAVRALIPLNGVPEEFHEEALAAIRKDYRWTNHSRGEGDLSVAGFERLVHSYYERFMYPLKKSNTSYAKQPEFDTSKHDDECGCGGIKFALGHGDQKRACCGNPAWWRPQHRKAVAAKKPKTQKRSTSSPAPKATTLYLLEGTATVRGANPKGVVLLTDTTGRWLGTFDPADPDLSIDETKLVRVVANDGERVGTTDTEALQAAGDRWASRWVERAEQLQRERSSQLAGAREAFGVAGAGLAQLIGVLGAYAWDFADDIMEFGDAVQLIGAKPPKIQRYGREQMKAIATWAAKDLTDDQREQLAAILLLSTADERVCGSSKDVLDEERQKAEAAIRTVASPWTKKRAGYTDGASAPAKKPAAAKKVAATKSRKRAPNPAFMRPLQPSPELAAVVGNRAMPRTEVTKKLWDYVRKNGLLDQKNRRQINADEKLRPVFGGKTSISMFEMTKAVNEHLTEAVA